MSAHVLLNSLNGSGNWDKMRGLPSMTLKLLLSRVFVWNVKILSYIEFECLAL